MTNHSHLLWATHSWPGGFARVLDYDPQIGATGYVTKYVVKDFGDWNLYPDQPGGFVRLQPNKTLFD